MSDQATDAANGHGAAEDEPLPQVEAGPEGEGGYDAGGPDDGPSDLMGIADATAKLLKSAPLTEEQQKALIESAKPIPIGVMGWCAKVGGTWQDKQKTKWKPGMRIRGQIVSTNVIRGKFGSQQYVTISGRYVCPKHVNAKGEVINAVDAVGRWLLAIDSTLTELPQFVGAVVDVELEKRGGSGVRHTYKRVDVYQR